MRTSFTQYCKHTLHLTIALFLLGIGGQAYAQQGSGWYLKGGFNNWGTDNEFQKSEGQSTIVAIVALEANKTYEFKLHKPDNDWRSNTTQITASQCTDIDFSNNTDNNCKIQTTIAGRYTFIFDESTNKLSVIYPTGWYLRGTLTDWATGHEFLRPTPQSMPQITLSLEAEKDYEFKLYNNEWYGNDGTMTADNSTDWLFETTKNNNCKITTTLAGDYIFTFDITNRKLSVTYPPIPAIPAVTTPLSIVYNTLYNDSDPLIGGDGTQDNPYLIYIGKPLYLIDQTKYNTAHLYYNWGGMELLSTQPTSHKDTIIPTDTELHSLQVQAYYQYSGIRGTAATQTIYYQGVVTPKLTLSSSATEVEKGSSVSLSIQAENIIPIPTEYKYYIKTPDGEFPDGIDVKPITAGTPYEYLTYSNKTGDYLIFARIYINGHSFRSDTITIYAYDTYGVHIKAPTDRNIHVYTWNDATGKKNAEWPGQPISQVAQYINGWWIYPFQAPDYTHLILNDGTDSHKTPDTQITGDICFELSNLWQLTQTECQELYRIESTTKDGKKYYSNITSAAGDTMSFYAEQFGQIVIKKFEGTKWIRMEGMDNIPSLKKKSGVYTMKNPAKGLVREEDLTPYTGDYYIHTNGCSGQKDGWKSVSQLTPSEKDSARFIYFEPNDNYPNENYNHYWVRFLPSGTNLQAVIGNEYNDCLADTLKGDQCTDQYGTLTIDANVRFAYNNKTNSFTRSHLQGSNTPDYLSISGTNMHLTEGETGEDLVTARFNDISDWVYELDVYAHPGAKGHINAPFKGHDQYLFGLKTDNTPIELDILGEATDAGSYHIRLIYDYKTNRLISAWMPDNDLTINEDRPLYANMMILRKENEPAGQIILNNNAKITGLKQLYSVLEITKENWNQTGGFFWFSLPYDCLVKDVFGIPGYGNKWTIQRYRGDKRAELGWRSDIPTFWANMKQTATATIEANRGYVVAFNLTDNDFNTIDGKSILRLYFPSVQKAFTLQQTPEMMTVAVPGHPCTIKDREDEDRDWNVIGVPGYRNITVTANTEAISPAPQFVYVWNWNNGERSYDVTDAQGDFNYQTMYSYMTQFAGNIDWSQYSEAIAPHELQAKRGAAQKDAKMCLHLQKEDNSADRTYIYLTDKATTAFDINYDLTKIFSSSASQIGTKSQNSTLAANCLPIENCTIPVELQIATNSDYTLQMADIPAHITALLYDRQEDRYVNLAFDNYTINLQAGNYTQRFEVQIEVHKVINELADTESRYHITCLDGQILIDNIDDKADIQLYDALGRLLYADTAYKGQTIDLPQTGIYVISINGETQRILMR